MAAGLTDLTTSKCFEKLESSCLLTSQQGTVQTPPHQSKLSLSLLLSGLTRWSCLSTNVLAASMAVAYGTLKQQLPPSLLLLVLAILCMVLGNVSSMKVVSKPGLGDNTTSAKVEQPTENDNRHATPAEDSSTFGASGTPSYQFVEQGNISVMYEKFTTFDKSTIHVASFSGSEITLPSTFRLQIVSEVSVSSFRCIPSSPCILPLPLHTFANSCNTACRLSLVGFME